MALRKLKVALMVGAIGLAAPIVRAQEPPQQQGQQPAQPAGQGQLPEVEVIQKQQPKQAAPAQKAAPAKKAAQPKAAPKKQVAAPKAPPPQKKQAAAPPPPPAAAPEPDIADSEPDVDPASINPNSVYGAEGSAGAAARAANGAATPVNAKQLIPTNLENFAGSATNVTPEILGEREPRNVNEALTRVPGVIIINDDGNAHHGGIGLRGSPPRRSRKVLVMEDGQPVNLALWLDPSVHFAPPIDRLEGIEVIRGTVTTHGPNNNFGVVNFRNLSPFGANETVISSAIGFTENDTGFFVNEDGEVMRSARGGDGHTDISARWHVHTRQTVDNVGVVASYTGADAKGAWDNERLRFNDFYGAIGWKGIDQDLVVSGSYTKQRDDYDESNLELEDDSPPGAVEAAFFDTKHCKTCFAPGAVLNRYYGEIYRGQIVHNLYLTDDTTITSRVYAGRHARDRYQIVTLEDNPAEAEERGVSPAFEEGDPGLFDVVLGEDSMFGRIRTFRHVAGEVRAEFANLPLAMGMTQVIQMGVRYEYQDMRNRNILGDSGIVLREGDETGFTIFERNLDANTVSAFLQTNVKVASDFHVIPGVRFEHYKVKRQSLVTAEEEGEAEEADGADCDAIDQDECLVIEGINRNPFNDSTTTTEVLPGVALSYSGLYKTTLFGGYHRGLSTAVLRNEDFPAPDEIGDNFELGFRTAAILGLGLEVTGFHQRLKDFQFGSSFSSAGDRSFGRADEVEINGVEILGRVDTHPYIGGPINVFGEANYTYSRAIIEKGTTVLTDEDTGEDIVVSLAGNALPEVPFQVAALTVGVEGKVGWKWDASVTWTYRDDFFTDELNTPFGGDPEGENGLVPSVWLVSARANLAIGDTGASVFIAGDNLTDKLYITDREDGLKPGQGRTIWTGFKQKF